MQQFTMSWSISLIKQQLRSALPTLVIIGLFLAEPSSCLASWSRDDIGFSFNEQKRVIIGNGRDDGVIRVYVGDNDASINEFSFDGNNWDKVSFGQDVLRVYGLAIGDAHNDGKMRVYTSGYNLAEYWYESSSWHGGIIGPYIQWTNDLILGNARNDSTVRMYVAGWDCILELTYSNGVWNEFEINTGSQSIKRLLIADGRNDGILRLYAATGMDDHVYEYNWSGSTWEVEDCGASGAGYYYDMVAGEGRNDGTNRIYLAAGGGIYELSYDGSSWGYEVIANPAPYGYVGVVALGDGRNDGMNRIYSWYSPNIYEQHMAEFTYNGTWSATSLLDSDIEAADIAVGNGRNDSVNRIYTACADNHVYEYSYSSTSVEEFQDSKACLYLDQIYTNPFNETTSIQYSLMHPGHVTLDIYDLRGNLVRTPVDQMEGVGEHIVNWDGKNQQGRPMVPGVYLFKLETPGFIQTNKLILIR